MSLSNFKRLSSLAAFLIATPLVCLPAAINVNGTCELGNCSTPDTLNSGGSSSGTFTYIYTFADTDKYFITGSYSTSYTSSTSINFTVNTSYIGNSTNTASSADVLPIDLLQNFNFTGNPNGKYTSTAKLTETDTNGSFAEAHVSYDGQSTGLLGPYYGPGTKSFTTSKTLSGLTSPILADFNFTFSFAKGTAAVPEPAGVGLLGLGLLTIGLVAVRYRRKQAVLNSLA